VAGTQPQGHAALPVNAQLMTEHGRYLFSIITRQAGYSSVAQLHAAIDVYIEGWNERCEPFTSTKIGDELSVHSHRERPKNFIRTTPALKSHLRRSLQRRRTAATAHGPGLTTRSTVKPPLFRQFWQNTTSFALVNHVPGPTAGPMSTITQSKTTAIRCYCLESNHRCPEQLGFFSTPAELGSSLALQLRQESPRMSQAHIARHTTSWHDGGVAMLLPHGEIVAISAERVGDRYKHRALFHGCYQPSR